uniref:AlNc14C285G10170 protein n=1 Tax=Albugo laibachii Nc14 TaxID=890382 RepID=F0WV24_9STRA|nr:AlNc14C285G10170 [Albugo laibachii Nc14]|eukprot:CCA25261.1 AlNc14C285G10170 [Albugo laibachii Nc14]
MIQQKMKPFLWDETEGSICMAPCGFRQTVPLRIPCYVSERPSLRWVLSILPEFEIQPVKYPIAFRSLCNTIHNLSHREYKLQFSYDRLSQTVP